MTGKLIVGCGCMYSGKTTFLLGAVQRLREQGKNILLCKPSLDSRYGVDRVVAHGGEALPCSSVQSPENLFQYFSKSDDEKTVDGIAIDEVQFFPPEIVSVVQRLRALGKLVVCAGLDTDWRGRPFGSVPELRRQATQVTQLYARCAVCDEQAGWTQRLIDEASDILLGSHGVYEPRCTQHFTGPELHAPQVHPELSDKDRHSL